MKVACAAMSGVALLGLACGYPVSIEKSASTSIATDAATSPAVLVHLRLSDNHSGSPLELDSAQKLELRIERAISAALVGELDGNEVGEGEYVIYCYGPDAESLFKVVAPIVAQARWSSGGSVVKRFGPVGAREEAIPIPALPQ